MAKNNRVCKVCNEEYYFCPTCSRVPSTEKYRIMFCSKNCRDIFDTLSRYTMKCIDKNETKEILSSLDLSKQSQFSDKVKIDINEIIGTNKKSFKKKMIEEPVVVETVVAIEEPAIVEEPVVIEESVVIDAIDTTIPTEI